MALEWLISKDQKDKKDNKSSAEDEFEIKPKELMDKLQKVDSLSSSVEELKNKATVLDRMSAFLDEQNAEKIKRQKEEKQHNQAKSQEELDEMFITDPANATRTILRDTMNPLIAAQVNTTTSIMMRDLFNEHPEEFEYATDPKIRSEVERQIMSLPVEQRANVETIRNCYFVVEGRHKNEIKEGKIKSRLSSASSSASGTGSPTSRSEEVIVLSDQEKKAARVFGLTEQEYAKSKKELSYV